MNYRTYGKLGYKVSALGMGCMRLPCIRHEDGHVAVDTEKAHEMIRFAVENGINYFDTAYTYHNYTSEAVLGEALETYGLRSKVKIATKQPFFLMKTQSDIRRNLESTLKKLRTDHIDVYLIHNISSDSWEEIKHRKIIEEYEKFRAEGLIGAIGYSYHGRINTFRDILAYYDWGMCQVQQNILDSDKEVTEEAIELAGKKGTALVIMEPLRGGGLASAPSTVEKIYHEYSATRTPVEWAFRHVMNYPAVSTVLSGMSTLTQLRENIETFSKPDAAPNCLSNEEKGIIARVKAAYEAISTVPCTGCEYCLPCPQGVAIPSIFSKYNDGMMFGNYDNSRRFYMFMSRDKSSADHCVNCGVCTQKCPQRLDIPKTLRAAHEALKGWVE